MKLYPWYSIVDENLPLAQGDMLKSCSIIVPTTDLKNKRIKTDVLEYDVIIMSQSCDLLYKKVENVVVCPIISFSEIEEQNPSFKSLNWKNKLREGVLPGYHLLNKCELENFERDFSIVDFHNIFGVPYDFLHDFIKESSKRLTLLPPYKEHLSQVFARFFMRVGLPVDIPEFKKEPK